MRYTGLRVSELTDLRLGKVNLDGQTIEVVGKGARQRIIPIPDQLVTILRVYLAEVRPRCPTSAYLFASPDSQKTGSQYGRIAVRAVHDVCVKYGEATGVSGKHHPHRWRHGYATDLLRRRVNLDHIRRLLGDSDIATTARYLHVQHHDLTGVINGAFHEDASDETDDSGGIPDAA